MKSRFYVVFIMALFSVSLVSCAGKQVEKKTEKEGQAKDTTKELTVELGGSIDQLVRNGKLQYNTQGGAKYSMTNKTLGNTTFEEAGVNMYHDDCDTIKNIHYGLGVKNTSLNEKYTELYIYLKNKYGNPTYDKKNMSSDRIAIFASSVWEFNDKTVVLSSTCPIYEESGSVVVVFMTPSDSKNFDVFL